MENSPLYTCPECSGKRVAAYVADTRLVKTENSPELAWNSSSLVALVCTICGHVTLYARELNKLLEQ